MRSFYNEHWFTITNVHFLLTNSPKNRKAMRRKLSVCQLNKSIHIRWLNGSKNPNLLNRMQDNEGWLTHLSTGVVSQFQIS